MKKLLLGLTLLASMSSFADSFKFSSDYKCFGWVRSADGIPMITQLKKCSGRDVLCSTYRGFKFKAARGGEKDTLGLVITDMETEQEVTINSPKMTNLSQPSIRGRFSVSHDLDAGIDCDLK